MTATQILSRVPAALKDLTRSFSGTVGLVLVGIFLLSSILAGFIAPRDPYQQDAEAQLAKPSWTHPMGTDNLGRDIMSRIVYGTRISLQIGIMSVGIAIMVGLPVGLVCGYFGGRLDLAAMRIIDIMMSFPSILLAITVMAVLGPSLTNVMVAVGVVNIPLYTRQVRASVLGIRELDYVTASRASGAGDFRILLRTILPNVVSPVIVLATLGFGTAILEAAGLSFLGLGGEPDLPEWGNMLTTTRQFIRQYPWVSIAPGVAISLTVLGFSLLGDALRDILDPKSTGRG